MVTMIICRLVVDGLRVETLNQTLCIYIHVMVIVCSSASEWVDTLRGRSSFSPRKILIKVFYNREKH